MSAAETPSVPKSSMSVLDAIYRRRAVRDYKPEPIDRETIEALLDAAVHAPTAMHIEPWSFVVIQDKDLLNKLSDKTKEMLLKEIEGQTSAPAQKKRAYATDPNFNVFYNAKTLILICAKSEDISNKADCWLAAQNLMLAACANGLGTCVIGLAIGLFNTPEVKEYLGIPANVSPAAPILLGIPAGDTPNVPRKPPEILSWK